MRFWVRGRYIWSGWQQGMMHCFICRGTRYAVRICSKVCSSISTMSCRDDSSSQDSVIRQWIFRKMLFGSDRNSSRFSGADGRKPPLSDTSVSGCDNKTSPPPGVSGLSRTRQNCSKHSQRSSSTECYSGLLHPCRICKEEIYLTCAIIITVFMRSQAEG